MKSCNGPRWPRSTFFLKLSGNRQWLCLDHDSGTPPSTSASTAAVSANPVQQTRGIRLV